MILRSIASAIFFFVLVTVPVHAQQPVVLNFDKLLIDTDKLVYIAPPEGVTWYVLQGSTMIERPVDATFMLWLENAPYAPYRDPRTGEMRGCYRCVNLRQRSAVATTFFDIKGQSMPIIISYPNRMMIALTPVHGGLSEPVMTWTRLQVIETQAP